ncbi:hypothetical protein LEMA_P080570.1 [Plenodomus lingam JN3]|uniref:Uncharacterized protein n=1 Tax=Leptosphaeria maculans (strain JN3 / isolate v23.1.3 / race Av1-4-5-6-7-8) TaxID=985895 RepID=E5A5C0_LEPMJ|nr:hypothetical protein LEMA_P080570.1 [Plenodomus lingam JN3]CBX98818.1 hypothetical protein LEMA_P080570.1 [Plenodomus lingam JN3]
MSQPSTQCNDASLDPFFLSFNHEHQQQLPSRAELEELFSSNRSEPNPISSNNSEVFNDLDFSFDDASLAQINSSTPSSISTPDWSTYSFGNSGLSYPTPEPNSPHPYPLDVKQSSDSPANTHLSLHNSRPPHLRSNTTTTCPPPAQPYVRRRSLSQGDADRIAAANTIPNPTFVRLQAPRSRSTTPEEKKRCSPYAQHGRSASQGLGPRGRPLKQPTTPHGRHGSPLIGGMFSTPIGTPLDDVMEVDDSGYTASSRSFSRSSHHAQGATSSSARHKKDGAPVFKRLMRPEDLAKSRHIIQIGAMATKTAPVHLDPNLQGISPSASHHDRILKKLDDIEHHLRLENGGNADALRGCTMIREALAKKMEMEHTIMYGEKKGKDDALDAPSTVFSEMGCSFLGGGDDDNELMKLLMQETKQADCKHDGE